jgi:hypothetical protein
VEVAERGSELFMHGYASAEGDRTAFMVKEETGRTWTLERWRGGRRLSTTKGLIARDAKWAAQEWTR